MRTEKNLILTGVMGVVGLVGCGTPPSRLNAPPQGYTESPADSQEIFTYMVDNAMLADMSIADIHFVPHSPEINSLGLRRLDRYASLLKIYGATLWYDTQVEEEDLVAKRIENVKGFLASAGVDPAKLDVKTGLPGGRGMLATEAALARKNAMVQEKAAGAGGGAVAMPLLTAAPAKSK